MNPDPGRGGPRWPGFLGAPLSRVTFAVEEDEAALPVPRRSPHAVRMMLKPQDFAEVAEKLFGRVMSKSC